MRGKGCYRHYYYVYVSMTVKIEKARSQKNWSKNRSTSSYNVSVF